MEVDSVLVTGANRGIGLEFARQLVRLPRPPRLVFATYRNRDTVQALEDIRVASKSSQVLLIKMDVTNTDEVEAARKIVDDMVGEKGLTLLVNNAGMNKKQDFREITDENLLFHFNTNTIGPIKVLKEMFPLLQRAAGVGDTKKSFSRAGILNLSSKAGSMGLLATHYQEYLDRFGYRISKALKDIKDASKKTQVLLIKMDVTKTHEVEAARKIVEDMVGEKGLTLLVNNAGALHRQAFQEITDENLLFHFNTNTIGPIKVLKEMLPLLQRAATAGGPKKEVSRAAVLNISSTAGSNEKLDGTQPPEWLKAFGYRISKAALNMAMRLVAAQTKEVLVVQMCPGWVKTDMGSDQAILEVSECVASILDTLPRLNESHHGAFIDYKGDTVPF